MKNNYQCNFNGVRMGGGSIEHPLSIHSASIGTRWKPRGMQLICTLVLLFTFAIGQMWAKEVTFTTGSNTAITKKASTSSPLLYMVRGGGGATYTSDYGIQLKTDLVFVFTIDATTDLTINLKSKDTNNAGRDNKFKLYSLNSKKTGFLKILEYSVTNNAKLDASYNVLKSDEDVVAFSASSISNGNYCSIDNNPAVGSLIGSELTLHTDKNSPKSGGYSSLSAGTYILFCTAAPTTNVCMYSMTFTSKTNPTITFNDGAYTVGGALDLSTLFASNSDGAVTYTVKTKGGTNASIVGTSFSASAAGTAVVTASQAATSTYNAATKDANIVVSIPSTPTHSISYTNLKGSDVSTYPTEYYEGTGIASFAPLADVANFHFTGWDPATISDTEDQNVEVEAQWVDAYNVSFSAGAGSGTAPDGFQKWEGAKFNLPGQGEMVAPANTVFDGWKASGTKYAENAEYTMSNAAVEFVAQWKAVPVVLFHYQQSNLSGNLAAGTYDAIGGTLTTSAAMSKESAAYNAAVPNDLKGGANVSKLGSNAAYIQLTLTTGKFKEGDTVYICGYNPYKISSTTELTADIAASFTTGTAKGDYNIGYAIIPEGIEQSSIYLSRAEGNGTGFAAVKVIRPAAKEVVSTVNTLTDVKVNGTSISVANLQTLVSEQSLALSDELVSAPTITFNKHTVITYDDNSNKVTDTPIEVTATDNGAGKWSASTTIDEVNYTVTLVKLESYEVSFDKNGGEGNMNAVSYAAGAAVTLPACTFTAPSGKEFDKWISDDVTITSGTFNMPASDVTVKASWKDITYAVTYHANGAIGTVPAVNNYVANAEVTVLGNTGSLTKTIGGEPAVFHGWNTNSDMISGAHYEAGAKFNMPAADVDLYAVWGFAINYDEDGGTINDANYASWYVSTGTTTSISTPLPSNVTREGYTFDGWYTQNGAGNKVTSINAEYTGDFAGDWALKAKWILSAPIGKAQSIDMEGLVESDGTSAEWQNYLYSHGYSFSTENVSLDEKKDPSEDKAYDNWPYQGLKMKKTGSYVQGTVDAGKLVVIKLGHMAAAATVTIGGVAQANATGLDAAEPAGKYNYYYVASESVLRYETNSNDACVLKAITITAPYTVSFDVNGGDAAIASMTGTPSIILPTPTKGTETFLGWFVGENKIGEAGASYTPVGNVELVAHWEAVSSDARLSAIEITPNTGVLAPAFNMELTEYTYTMPYGTAALPQITGATPNHEGASYGYLVQAENWGDVAEVRGIALSNDTKKYQITMVQGPKDGVEIISIAVKNGNGNAQTIAAEDISGFIGGTATQKLQSGGTKLGGNDNYIGFTLANSETLKAGDVIRLTVTAPNGASHLTLYQDASTANLVKDINWTATTGVNLIPVPAEAVGLSTLYIYRTSSACNPTLSNFAILRPMDPVMTAITINGRDGEIDPLDDKHFNVTIPFESELDNLTVEPTVFWNGAHATTPGAVTSHEGAWVLQAEGDNTYRVMDKDGDYTDYTITLIRDIQKFTVSYNTHGGTAIEPELVVAGEKLAAAPADPTREDYIFQGWSLTEDGAVIDITNVTIDEDKTFHAIWLYENPIKLIDNHAINNDDFITGVTLGNVTIGSEQVECFEFAGGLSNFINIKDKDRVVVYNATTDKTKIKVTMYNNKSSALTYYIKGVVEGSSDVVDIATVEVASGETKTSGYYEFNSDEAKNRSIYVYAETSAGNMHFLQVKVIDNGDVPVKKVAEVGYSLNFNKGRLFGRGNTSVDFEGIHFDLSSDYQPTASTSLKFANNSISFDVTDFVTMSVTTSNNKTYYVSRGAAGTDNETAVAGTTDFTLTPGKWFITAGSQNVEITNIAFAAKTPDYTRNVSVNIGTLCMEHNVLASGAVGATFYQIIGRNKDYSYKIDFEEIGPDEELKAGEPYIFHSTTGKIELYYGKTVAPQPVPVKGMIGNFEASSLEITTENMSDILYIAQNKLWTCENLVGGVLTLNDHRAYIKMSDVPEQEDEAPAPGRRRVTLGMNAEQVVTAIGNTELNEQAVKVMIDGQLFIIRGEKMFDATGRLVK